MRHSVVSHTMIVAVPCVLNVLVVVSHVSSLCLNQFNVFNSIDPSSVLKGSMAMASRTFGSQRLGAATSILHGIPRRPHHQLGRTTLAWVTGKMQCAPGLNRTAPHRTAPHPNCRRARLLQRWVQPYPPTRRTLLHASCATR